jgi:hypothetical protein
MSEKLYPEPIGLFREQPSKGGVPEWAPRAETLDQIIECAKVLTPLREHQKHNGFIYMRMEDYRLPDSDARVTVKQFDLFHKGSPAANRLWEEQLEDELGLIEVILSHPTAPQERYNIYQIQDGRKVLKRTKRAERMDANIVLTLNEDEAMQLLELLQCLQEANDLPS